jgi:hypothetical protein
MSTTFSSRMVGLKTSLNYWRGVSINEVGDTFYLEKRDF